jgi:FkbM family methyltransferase
MLIRMKKIIKLMLPKFLIKFLITIDNNYFARYSLKSYSQEGEDMILRRIFDEKAAGFYVDVGAHHPFRFSNTFYFYKKGWRGINIDAMPGSMSAFERFRPLDINLEIPVGNGNQILTYYSFNEPALNSFSEELSNERDGRDGYFIKQKIEMKITKLSLLLDKYMPKNLEIDFLSIDVEGFDLNILKSNDWLKYRPKCILVEILGSSMHEIENNEITSFLKECGYAVFAKSLNTVFFKLQGPQPACFHE